MTSSGSQNSRTGVDLEGDKVEGLRTRIVRVVREHTGLHEKFALPIADQVLDSFREEFAGDHLYINGKDPDRDTKVRTAFNGRNRDEVMKMFNISKATFYRIIGERA